MGRDTIVSYQKVPQSESPGDSDWGHLRWPTKLSPRNKLLLNVFLLTAIIISLNASQLLSSTSSLDTLTSPVEDSTENTPLFGSDERFILPVDIMEQESRAQLYFRTVSFLSKLVNRTIILPNVDKSRLGACYGNPFESYYDIEGWVSKHPDGFKYALQEDFERWTAAQSSAGHKPTAQLLRVGLLRDRSQRAVVKLCEQKWVNELNTEGNKGEKIALQIMKAKSLKLNGGHGDQRTTENVVNFINQLDSQVILLEYGPSWDWLTTPGAHDFIPYSRDLSARTDVILNFMKPSVVIHWRMETIDRKLIPGCARQLVDHVHNLRNTLDFDHIYFMTDYALTPGHWRSSSFGQKVGAFTSEYEEGMRYIKANLNITSAFYDDGRKKAPRNTTNPSTHTTLTFLPIPPSTQWPDLGQLGIIEKLVATNSFYFSTGAYGKNRCAKKSSYVAQIVKERKAQWKMENLLPESERKLSNVVDFWGIN